MANLFSFAHDLGRAHFVLLLQTTTKGVALFQERERFLHWMLLTFALLRMVAHMKRQTEFFSRDIHSLFDAGYVTISPEMKFEVIHCLLQNPKI